VIKTGSHIGDEVIISFQPMLEVAIHIVKIKADLHLIALVGGFCFMMLFISLVLLACLSWGTFGSNNAEKYEVSEEEEVTPEPKIPQVEQITRRESTQGITLELPSENSNQKSGMLTDHILKLFSTVSVFY
jgi:hypothetical protein